MSTPRHGGAQQTRPRDHAAQIYRELRELISSGRIAPGARLVEKDLAARFKVSRTPIRAALDRLEQEGFVITSPGLKHSLSQVAPLTRDDGVEVLGVLAALEGEAARRAAELPVAERRRLADAMRKVNARLEILSRTRSPAPQALQQLDDELHRLFIAAGAGPRLAGLLESIRPQALRYSKVYTTLLVQRIKDSVAEHHSLIRAIERGDGDSALEAAQRNHRRAGERLAEAIAHLGEQGSW
jgi:DNA-binding GntR family transcriptional regulator